MLPRYTTEYWTIAEAIERLGVTRSTIWRWEQQGKIHIEKIGNRKLIPVDAIVTLYLATGQPIPRAHEITGKLAQVLGSNDPLRHWEVSQVAQALARVLSHGNVSVHPAGLTPIVSGRERPQPVFWRSLARGLEDLLANQKAWTPSDEEVEEIKRIAKEKGIGFWQAAVLVEDKNKK